LDSIPYRDDIQVIIVDDNSDSAVVDFVQFPGIERIDTEVYFTKEGKGAGYARNIGLQHAKGKWLIFADADDFFLPSFNEALDEYKDNNNDVIYFHKVTISDSNSFMSFVDTNKSLSKVRKTNNWNHAITSPLTPWRKIIKHAFIIEYNIIFQESLWANDVFFSIKLAVYSTKKIISDFNIYCHVINRHESLMGHHTIESLCIRHQIHMDAFVYLKNIDKIIYSPPDFWFFWWIKLLRVDMLLAISLLPKMIKTCGLWYPFIGMSKITAKRLKLIFINKRV